MSKIVFGTSGWRGIFCEDFTYANVRVVTQAIADHLKANGEAEQGVVVGYDARFMGDAFAHETARVMAGAGIKSYVCNRDTPTPVIAFEILRRGAAGGINFTASHNPAQYNGLKFSPASGGPALPETTKDIETRANAMLGEIVYHDMPLNQAVHAGLVESIDPCDVYCQRLEEIIDFRAIAKSGLVIAVNPMYGTGRGYLDKLLRKAKVQVVTLNDHLDPYFGGLPPEPSESHIGDFIKLVREDSRIRLGLATDGDADRYGILDFDGSFIEPNYVLALLLDYFIRFKGQKGDAARSVATSHFIDAVAEHHGVKVHETPVGFKYIGDLISKGQIVLGGEESAGLSMGGHVPDKDGILACLLVAEMVAVTGKSLQELLADLYGRVGEFHTRRINLSLTPELAEGYADKVADPPAEFAGRKVKEIITIDGTKFLLDDGSWLLYRKSGTEPVVRLYGEAGHQADLDEILAAGKDFLLG